MLTDRDGRRTKGVDRTPFVQTLRKLVAELIDPLLAEFIEYVLVGEESQCGWCRDQWGVWWQITPVALTRAVTGPDTAVAKRAFEAMMTMKKIDIATIEAAMRG